MIVVPRYTQLTTALNTFYQRLINHPEFCRTSEPYERLLPDDVYGDMPGFCVDTLCRVASIPGEFDNVLGALKKDLPLEVKVSAVGETPWRSIFLSEREENNRGFDLMVDVYADHKGMPEYSQ